MSLIRPDPNIGIKGSAFYKIALAWIALLSGMVAVASYRYIFGLGLIPPNIASNALANPWLIIHATSAATALLLAPFPVYKTPSCTSSRSTSHDRPGLRPELFNRWPFSFSTRYRNLHWAYRWCWL